MSEAVAPTPGSTPVQTRRGLWPRTGLGQAAIVATLIGLASWVVLPMITVRFRDTYPIVDTWVMPAIGTVLIDVAAILNLAAVWLRHERSAVSVIALVLTLVVALFVTFMVLGESIAGA